MSDQQDFDVLSLSAYLHLSPDQVQKMAERGRLPGRRIGGQWRFSRADIHHWFEKRIGASDSEELKGVEQVLQRQESLTSGGISLSTLLSPECIAIPLAARTKNSAIDSMCQLAAHSGRLWDADAMADALRSRESLHPTALDNGVALLHPRRPMPTILADSFVAMGITSHGIPFGGPRGTLTDVFFLIASYDDAIHLRILARLSRWIVEPGFVDRLRQAEDAASAWSFIAENEDSIL
jgi:PTS system nitrogen regulatory IIA component